MAIGTRRRRRRLAVPELPEVETVRLGLLARVVGRRVDAVEVGRERTVRRTSRSAVIDRLTGTTIIAANRRGKYLVCPLDSGDAMMVHLRMSGQLLLAAVGADRPNHTHVVAHLGAHRDRPAEELWFVDPRTFGEVVIFDPDRDPPEIPELARLGIDPLADPFDGDVLGGLLRGRGRRLKALLLDQRVVAGLGNIYTDEVLHAARLHPLRLASSLKRADIGRLADSISAILTDAVRAGGSTLGDAQYVDLMGSGGSYQNDHRVYGRGGQACSSCGRGVVTRVMQGGRSTHFCPICQR